MLVALTMIVSLFAASCGLAERAEQAARSGEDGGGNVLTVSVFGGDWGNAIQQHVIDRFEQQTGVTVRVQINTSTLALGQLRQDPGIYDVVLLDSGVSELARAEDLVATLPEKQLTNLGRLTNRAALRDQGGLWAVTMGFWSLGIAYNTEKVAQPPSSWADLWDPKFAGRVAVPTPATTGGLPLLLASAEMFGRGPSDVDAGFTRLEQLKVAAYADSSGTASNLLQSGEAVVAAHYNSGTWPLADQGLPIGWVAPKEGALAADSRWHLAAGSPKRDLAAQFIDFASGVAAQQGLVDDLYLAPADESVQPTGKAAERMPWGASGSLKDLRFPDWNVINAHRQEFTDRWNKQVAK
ncbi:putative spermidine/putrescine transport system substrate-binding protein [Tamaricihabitans halophyticus]|uniref:Putative spermidine/putrescine transport system substrate-binding protein n=1 Tax=Tamaricihabitans halophyticus TaxID=1262583 RepID=A0A4R2R4H0_9PSEU|nr:putative spermidine/putrescine transport system substrate-binding protein [Tamaricihabitans halophyticus]